MDFQTAIHSASGPSFPPQSFSFVQNNTNTSHIVSVSNPFSIELDILDTNIPNTYNYITTPSHNSLYIMHTTNVMDDL
jgi:hypothetical protein